MDAVLINRDKLYKLGNELCSNYVIYALTVAFGLVLGFGIIINLLVSDAINTFILIVIPVLAIYLDRELHYD